MILVMKSKFCPQLSIYSKIEDDTLVIPSMSIMMMDVGCGGLKATHVDQTPIK